MGPHSLFRTGIAAAAIAIVAFGAPFNAGAQDKPAKSATPDKEANKDKKDKKDKPIEPSPFFESEQPLELTFTTNLRRLRGDKGTTPPWRAATISYAGADGKPVVVPLKVRTRGIWRLKNCDFPPVRLNFAKAAAEGTIFKGLDKPKLVSYCRDKDSYEEYVLQELQLYRVYRLLTPFSHGARLVRMIYADSATGRPATTRFAFIMEELSVVAARAGATELATTGARPGDLDPHHDALVGVFQYLIGNTDFSIGGLHNAELLQRPDGTIFPVAFDFDFSGAVDSHYATVDSSLRTKRVRDRLFRGLCVDTGEFNKVFALFNDKKAAIYALYRDDVGKRLTQRTVDETLKYFDEFYRTINNPRMVKREILDACRGGN